MIWICGLYDLQTRFRLTAYATDRKLWCPLIIRYFNVPGNLVTIIVRWLACVGWVDGVASASERHKSVMIISYTWNWLFSNLQDVLACSICSPIVCDQWMQKMVLRHVDSAHFNGEKDPISEISLCLRKGGGSAGVSNDAPTARVPAVFNHISNHIFDQLSTRRGKRKICEVTRLQGRI